MGGESEVGRRRILLLGLLPTFSEKRQPQSPAFGLSRSIWVLGIDEEAGGKRLAGHLNPCL